jgi:hypothetical protein
MPSSVYTWTMSRAKATCVPQAWSKGVLRGMARGVTLRSVIFMAVLL